MIPWWAWGLDPALQTRTRARLPSPERLCSRLGTSGAAEQVKLFGNHPAAFHHSCTISRPPAKCEGDDFSISLSTLTLPFLVFGGGGGGVFCNRHGGCEVPVAYWGFDGHFPDDW